MPDSAVLASGGKFMNQYGMRARAHWTLGLPQRTAQLEDPDAFFTSLGEQVANAVHATEDALAAHHPDALRAAD